MAKYSVIAILASLWIASIFYVTASGINCNSTNCKNENGYAVAVGVVSLVFSVIMLGLELMIKLGKNVHMGASLFLLVWWIPGCGVGTFQGPFLIAQNGYFSAWFALIVSTYYVFLSIELVRAESVKKIDKALATLGVLFITTVFYLAAAAYICENPSSLKTGTITGSVNTSCTSYTGYAVAVGSIGLVIVMGLIGMYIFAQKHFMSVLGKGIVGFLTLWWLLGAAIATFKEPFPVLSNGYFASWFSFLACLYLLSILFPKVSEKINSAVHPEATQTEMEKQQQSELASSPAPAV